MDSAAGREADTAHVMEPSPGSSRVVLSWEERGQRAGLFHPMPPTHSGGQEARKVCGRARGHDKWSSGGAWQSWHTGDTTNGEGNLQAWPALPRLPPADLEAWGPKVTLATPGRRWWAQATGGQKRLWIPTAGRNSLHMGVCRTEHGIISTRHPALPSSKFSSPLRSLFG